MTKFSISLAGVKIGVSAIYESTRDYCCDYLTEGNVDFSIAVTPADIEFEREKSAREDAAENIPTRIFSDSYLETIAVYRKIADKILNWDTLLFHGSVVAVDGEGYLFTATSGTGKSTHTRLWRETFGDRACMINDDKPLLRLTESGVWVCGTPWDGKHRLNTNTMVPLKGICILERGEKNAIWQISADEALPMLLQQCHRPSSPSDLVQVLAVMGSLMEKMKFYRLRCTIDPMAAQLAYDTMRKG